MARKKRYARRHRAALKTFFKEWRVFRGLTQQRLADRLYTTKTRVSMKERGVEGWDDAYLAALADALNTDPASLIMRNPLETDSPWSLIDGLKPESRAKVLDYIRLVRASEESEATKAA
jgi:transcriptional regulator with XRE-family HTH domain